MPPADLDALGDAYPFLPSALDDILEIEPSDAEPAALLSCLSSSTPRALDALVGGSNLEGGSGGNRGRFLEVGRSFLKANLDRRYPDLETARSAEMGAEDRRRRLGIYHPSRIFFLSRGRDGWIWACSSTRRLPILRDLFRRASGALEDEERCWSLYAGAVQMTFELAVSESIMLDCNPNNFAYEDDDRLYYVDDDLIVERRRSPLGHQVLLRLREYAHFDLSGRRAMLDAFVEMARAHASIDWLREILVGDLEQEITWPEDPELRQILDGLVKELRPMPRRAP